MTDDQRCRTCKWWEQIPRIKHSRFKQDEMPYQCLSVDMGSRNPLARIAGLARLITAPDFGCVQWEKKPDA